MAPGVAIAQSQPSIRVSRLASAGVPAGAKPVGPVAAGRVLPLTIALAPSDPAQITALLHDLYDPSSPRFHRWLSSGQFVARFGPAPAVRTAMTGWLRQAGATGVHVAGFAVHANLTAARLSSALGTSLERYQLPSGQVGYRAQRAPLLPANIANDVQAIIGLDTLSPPLKPLRHPAAQKRSRTRAAVTPNAQIDGLTACNAAQQKANQGYYLFNEIGAAYGIGSLLSNGQNGHGQTIGVYELSPHSASDVSAYQSCFGLTNPVTTVAVDGGGTVSAGGTEEANVDIEQVATQAPAANIVSYEGPNSSAGAYDIWHTIVTADAAQVISTSWGQCEPSAAASGSIASFTTLFQQAAAQGQTILAATGDSGSEDCYPQTGSTAQQVDYPASDPWVTAVGGTSLLGPGDEVTWNDCQGASSTSCADSGGGAGGGGMSRYEPRPSYQPNVLAWPDNSQPCGNVHCREVPDISANAGVGMVEYNAGAWKAAGGTSLSAPLLAGLVADKNVGCTTNTGVWAPALYALAAQGVYGTALSDITDGDIDVTGSHGGAFAAVSGYDAATGLGVPRAAGLSCPEVTSVTPTAASPGASVTVSGLGLEKATISFGSAAATVTSASATSATVVVPAGTGTVAVSAQSAVGSGTQTAAFTFGSALVATSGTGQHAVSGSQFAHPLIATLTGPDGQPAVGTTVTFTVGKIGAATFPGGQTSVGVATDANGAAQSPALTAGSAAGNFTVIATAAGASSPATFALTTVPHTADLTIKLSGPKKVASGKRVTERIKVTNTGPSTATAVATTLKAAKRLVVVTAPGATRHGHRWTWSLAALAPGASHSYTVKIKAKRHHQGSASIGVKTSSAVRDPVPSNNKRKVTLHVG